MWHLLQAQKSRGVKLSVFGGAVKLSWFKIVRCQIVRCQIVWCQIVRCFFWDTLLQRPISGFEPMHLLSPDEDDDRMTVIGGGGTLLSFNANFDWNLHLDLPGGILINQTIFNISSFGEKVEIEIVASARFLLKLKPICILAKHCD